MRMTGSLVNNLMAASSVQPKPGDGATILSYTDRHAATIVAIQGNKRTGKVRVVTVRRDRAIRTDRNGMSESQEYIYEPNDDARPEAFSLRRNGEWVQVGESMNGGRRLSIGHRSAYYDYSF